MRIPLVLFGDAPGQPTGLSRILTDLASRTAAHLGDVFDVRTVGWGPYANLPTHGVETRFQVTVNSGSTPAIWQGWIYGDFGSRGVEALSAAYRTWFGTRPGIVLSVWDAARCEVVSRCPDLPVEWWGYIPVDAENQHGAISGPAKAHLERMTRVLAYGPYGSDVLRRTLGREVEALPHGIDRDTVWTLDDPEMEPRATQLLGGQTLPDDALIVGCVATNQRRKDLGLYAQVLGNLIRRETPWAGRVYGWLHTDKIVGDAWSVPQLMIDCGLVGRLVVTTSLRDRELAALYRSCALTIAPGRGEGFGYPIVESLACGTPVLHVDYAGGADLTPRGCRVPARIFQLEGVYAEERPVLDVTAFSALAARVVGTIPVDPATARKYTDPYDWQTLWPRWADWLRAGATPR